MEKRCFKCLQTKPMADFYQHARMKDGRLNKCIVCTKADVAAHRLTNLHKVREYDKQRASAPHRVAARLAYQKTDAYAISHQKSTQRLRLKHPERRAANVAVGNAVRDGRLTPLPCLVCGAEKVEGHHPDYCRPLSVVWLCKTHHDQAHVASVETV